MTTLVDMNQSEQKKICISTLKAQFFIFHIPDIKDFERLYNRDESLSMNLKIIPSIENSVFNEGSIQFLKCSFGSISFFLAKYSKHEGYILFATSVLRIVGVVTTSYSYQECHPKIKKKLWQNKTDVQGK